MNPVHYQSQCLRCGKSCLPTERECFACQLESLVVPSEDNGEEGTAYDTNRPSLFASRVDMRELWGSRRDL